MDTLTTCSLDITERSRHTPVPTRWMVASLIRLSRFGPGTAPSTDTAPRARKAPRPTGTGSRTSRPGPRFTAARGPATRPRRVIGSRFPQPATRGCRPCPWFRTRARASAHRPLPAPRIRMRAPTRNISRRRSRPASVAGGRSGRPASPQPRSVPERPLTSIQTGSGWYRVAGTRVAMKVLSCSSMARINRKAVAAMAKLR